MFIIWGFGKQTIKNYGSTEACNCERCNNNVHMQLMKITTWFTLFFIPIIPYKTNYVSSCPICSAAQELTKEDFFDIVENGAGADPEKKYIGKNETQINFLKQMEEAQNKK